MICGAMVAALGAGTAAVALQLDIGLIALMPHSVYCLSHQTLAGALGVIMIVSGLTWAWRTGPRPAVGVFSRRIRAFFRVSGGARPVICFSTGPE